MPNLSEFLPSYWQNSCAARVVGMWKCVAHPIHYIIGKIVITDEKLFNNICYIYNIEILLTYINLLFNIKYHYFVIAYDGFICYI